MMPPEPTERELAREAAQLRIAEFDPTLDREARAAAKRAREEIVERADWSSAANALAAMLGEPPERFEADCYEMPALDDLELVGGGGAA